MAGGLAQLYPVGRHSSIFLLFKDKLTPTTLYINHTLIQVETSSYNHLIVSTHIHVHIARQKDSQTAAI